MEYNAWTKINHPEVCLSACKCSDTSSEKVSEPASTGSPSPSKDLLSEVLPEPKKKTGKKGLNQKAVCITDVDVLNDLKAQEEEKAEIERQKLEKKRMREERKAEREKLKKEKEEKKIAKQLEKEKKTENSRIRP